MPLELYIRCRVRFQLVIMLYRYMRYSSLTIFMMCMVFTVSEVAKL